METIDIAIVGGGPAGLQAALVLARTRKRVVVFDAGPPRNAASHGVHNFLGMDGMLPAEIRDRAWSQLDPYGSARLVAATVTAVTRPADGTDRFVVLADDAYLAREVVLASGYRDVFPDIDGFAACWATSIIPCPFCDGYEQRDRLWGIVPSTAHELDAFPAMVRNWTDQRLVIAPRHLAISDEQRAMLEDLDVPLHRGDIVAIEHHAGHVERVTLDDGTRVTVDALLWSPDDEPVPLVRQLVDDLGVEVDDHGHVVVDELQRTNVAGLWAAGDVQGWQGAIESATQGGMAASMIVAGWYAAPVPVAS